MFSNLPILDHFFQHLFCTEKYPECAEDARKSSSGGHPTIIMSIAAVIWMNIFFPRNIFTEKNVKLTHVFESSLHFEPPRRWS